MSPQHGEENGPAHEARHGSADCEPGGAGARRPGRRGRTVRTTAGSRRRRATDIAMPARSRNGARAAIVVRPRRRPDAVVARLSPTPASSTNSGRRAPVHRPERALGLQRRVLHRMLDEHPEHGEGAGDVDTREAARRLLSTRRRRSRATFAHAGIRAHGSTPNVPRIVRILTGSSPNRRPIVAGDVSVALSPRVPDTRPRAPTACGRRACGTRCAGGPRRCGG